MSSLGILDIVKELDLIVEMFWGKNQKKKISLRTLKLIGHFCNWDYMSTNWVGLISH